MEFAFLRLVLYHKIPSNSTSRWKIPIGFAIIVSRDGFSLTKSIIIVRALPVAKKREFGFLGQHWDSQRKMLFAKEEQNMQISVTALKIR